MEHAAEIVVLRPYRGKDTMHLQGPPGQAMLLLPPLRPLPLRLQLLLVLLLDANSFRARPREEVLPSNAARACSEATFTWRFVDPVHMKQKSARPK